MVYAVEFIDHLFWLQFTFTCAYSNEPIQNFELGSGLLCMFYLNIWLLGYTFPFSIYRQGLEIDAAMLIIEYSS